MATFSPLALAKQKLKQAREDVGALWNGAAPAVSALLDRDHVGWIQPLNKVCFRSDTRPPDEIFRNGFLDRETTATFPTTIHFLATLPQVERDQRIVQLPVTELPSFRNTLHYFTEENPKTTPPLDVDPANAVALTRRLGYAPLFPLADSSTKTWATETWIYAVWIERAYMTYQRQLAEGSKLADAKEVAVRVVPGKHVIGAVKCVRKGLSKPGNEVEYTMKAPIFWNDVHTDAARRLTASNKFEKYLEKAHIIHFWGDTSLLLRPATGWTSLYKDMVTPEDLRLRKSAFNTFDNILGALRHTNQPFADAMQMMKMQELLVKQHSQPSILYSSSDSGFDSDDD